MTKLRQGSRVKAGGRLGTVRSVVIRNREEIDGLPGRGPIECISVQWDEGGIGTIYPGLHVHLMVGHQNLRDNQVSTKCGYKDVHPRSIIYTLWRSETTCPRCLETM